MRPTKKKLSLSRETVRQLGPAALVEVHGAIIVPTYNCTVPATRRHSCFDSCYNTDCCLEVP